MRNDGKINSWLRLAIAVSLFRLISILTVLLFSLLAHVIPHIDSFEPVLTPLVGVSFVVWFIVAMSEKLFVLAHNKKLMLAILFSVVALCPVYLTTNIAPAMDSSGVKELVHASSHGNITEVRKLIHDGVDPNAALNLNGWTSLHIAAAGGHADVVKALLDAGVPMDSKANANGMEGAEATFLAAMYGHTNVIAILSERGADLNHTFMGMTVSEYATYSEHPEAANFIDAIIKK